jgi:hypothetical protein|nr:MAG TPA: hypothetical protein [Caudoviricetes sp.]
MMFFKIYFSEEKFRKDAEAFNQKQIGRATRDYCRILSASPDEQYISPMEARARIKRDGVISAVNRIDAAREELLLLDTWDQDRKAHIGSNLIEARNSLNSVIWHLSKERKKNEFGR